VNSQTPSASAMGPPVPKENTRLEFYGGWFGAFAPLAFFGAAIVYLNVHKMATMAAYMAPLLLSIALVITLAKDKKAATGALIDGISDRTISLLILAFIGAGVLGKLLVVSGSIKAVVWVGYITGFQGTAFLVLTFVIACIVATSTGTVVTCTPILYPAGVLLGCHPALLLGAIYSGARFGDNCAPISSTTIAAAVTQEAEIGEIVKTRLKYAFAAAGISILLYVVFNNLLGPGSYRATGELATTVRQYAKTQSLPMLLAPALTIVLCVMRRSLVHSIWYGILAAIFIAVVTHSISMKDLYFIKAPETVGGALTDGILGMRDVIFLNIFIMAVLGALRESGALEALTVSITKFATTVKRAELSIFALVTFLYPLVSLNTPAILFAGPVCKEIGLKLNIHRSRRANLMDLAGNGITGNLPHINTILALAAAMMASHDAVGAPIVPITTIGLFTFHPIMLTLVALFAIATGWGHKKG